MPHRTQNRFSPGCLEKENNVKENRSIRNFLFHRLWRKTMQQYSTTVSFGLANKLTKYDGTLLTSINKKNKEVTSQTKAHFSDPKGPISFIGFLAMSNLAFDTNRIHEGPAMWVLLHQVKETIINALNSRMCTTDKSSHIAILMRNVGNWSG